MDALFCSVGAVLGMLYAQWMYSGKSGAAPKISPTISPLVHRGMVIVPIGHAESAKYAVHVHHWMLCLPMLLLPSLPSVVAGVCAVLAVQGLCYDDCLDVVCPNPYRETSSATTAHALRHQVCCTDRRLL